MRRAERKLQLSYEVVGGESSIHQDKSEKGSDAPDVHSLIFGLHIFDLTDLGNESSCGVNMGQLDAMTDKVVELRNHGVSEKDFQRFEINPAALFNIEKPPSISIDPELDESSYLSWVEKFKQASQSNDGSLVKNKRNDVTSKSLKRDDEVKKAHQKKLAKWEARGYQSLSVIDPAFPMESDVLSDLGSVQFVYGDCSKPSQICPSEPTVIFRSYFLPNLSTNLY